MTVIEIFGFLAINLIFGGIVGCVIGAFYFQINSEFIGKIVTVITTGVTIPGIQWILKISSNLQVENSVKLISILIYLFGLIIGFIIILRIHMRYLRKIDPLLYNSYATAVIMGSSGIRKVINDNYRIVIENERNKLVEKQSEYDLYFKLINKKENELDRRRNTLEEFERDLKKQIKNGVHFQLPVNSSIPITQERFDFYCIFIKKNRDFYLQLCNTTHIAIENKKNINESEIITGYFQTICNLLVKCFFNNSARAHFRYLKDKTSYVKLFTSVDESEVEYKLSDLPMNKKNMINASYETRRSLIKSLNLEHHYSLGNAFTWKDYITFAFFDFLTEDTGEPFLSMGVSIKDNDPLAKEMLYFLNYIEIGELIQEQLVKLKSKYNVFEVIQNLKK